MKVPPIWADYDDGDQDPDLYPGELPWVNGGWDKRATAEEMLEKQAATNEQYAWGIINKFGLPVGSSKAAKEAQADAIAKRKRKEKEMKRRERGLR